MSASNKTKYEPTTSTMRLLRAIADDAFELSEHDEGRIPPFAILSHTWGTDHEEVTYADIVAGTGKEKAGYNKLLFCASHARQDGLRYFWVDTCCIDKSSSAELSEAINCMFRWYSAATVCYVYLTDVMLEDCEHSFPLSRWHFRGWTLQELVAPKKVLFFESGGELLGDKNSLGQQLSEITRIPQSALEGLSLHRFSVGERMQWAAGRQTRRAEDAAYCLLGLFSINMPLIYGEGRERAFTRLRRELRSTITDPSIYGASLYNAVRAGQLASVEILLQDGVSVNYVHPTEHHETILHAAVRSGSVDVLRSILAAKPMLDPYSRQGITPLMMAAVLGNDAAVDMLIDAGCVLEFRLQPIRKHPDPTIDIDGNRGGITEGSIPLILAAQNGHLSTTKLLLDRGSNIHSKTAAGYTALICATYNGHADCVKLLLDNGAEVDVRVRDDFTALIYCGGFSHIECAKHLLDAGADIEARKSGGMNALLEAAWNGKVEFAEFIIGRGADPAAQAEWEGGYYGQMTALHIAVDNDCVDMVRALVRCGVPLDLKKHDGETALDFAKSLGRTEMIPILSGKT